jgi:hypothetical protein
MEMKAFHLIDRGLCREASYTRPSPSWAPVGTYCYTEINLRNNNTPQHSTGYRDPDHWLEAPFCCKRLPDCEAMAMGTKLNLGC